MSSISDSTLAVLQNIEFQDSAGRNFELDCKRCRSVIDFDFSYAFQPLVDIEHQTIFGYEALIRGLNNEPAMTILEKVTNANRYAFDQICRQKAIHMAAELGLDKMLSINFLPNAVYEPEHCIQSTLKSAEQVGFPIEQIMFEVTESEEVLERKHLTHIFEYYHAKGFTVALDDFGAGYAGLNMLSSIVPDILKIDMELVRDVNKDHVKQVIARHLVQMCQELKIQVLAEGIETYEEFAFYRALGVSLFQGYYFAKPGFESLPTIDFEALHI